MYVTKYTDMHTRYMHGYVCVGMTYKEHVCTYVL